MATKSLNGLRQNRQIVSAVCIQAKWRSHAEMKKSINSMANIVLIQAALKIQTAYRRYSCRIKWLNMVRNVIKCQSIVRGWKAVVRAEQLRSYRKQGPKDVFKFIKMRQAATIKIQHSYQDYATRSFDSAYHGYMARMNHAVEKSAEESVVKTVSFCEPEVQQCEKHSSGIDAEVCDLLLKEEIVEQEPAKPDVDPSVVEKTASEEAASKEVKVAYVVDEEDANLESKCFDGSRCGLSDGVHGVLMASGKFLYEYIGDPSEDTAEDLLTVMEMGEEAAFCCWKTKPSKVVPQSGTAYQGSEVDKEAAAIVIQSKYRRHRMKMNQHRSPEQAEVFDTSKSSEIETRLSTIRSKNVPAIVKCQSAIRGFLAFRRVQKVNSSSKQAIETLLGESNQDDVSVTDCSDTSSSIGLMSDIYEGSINV